MPKRLISFIANFFEAERVWPDSKQSQKTYLEISTLDVPKTETKFEFFARLQNSTVWTNIISKIPISGLTLKRLPPTQRFDQASVTAELKDSWI